MNGAIKAMTYLTALAVFMVPAYQADATIAVNLTPASIIQGDPVMITITGANPSDVHSASVNGTPVKFFTYDGTTTAIYGSSIDERVGTSTITVIFDDGSKVNASFTINKRYNPAEYLPVPEKLGGNSTANQMAFVATLAKDNASIASAYSRMDKALWTTPFTFPVASTSDQPRVVTDPYGYNRDSGAATVTHKGVDFRAPPGTPVYAVNRGVVRVNRYYTVYGNTVIVDHGLGFLSMYMHLSKSYVWPGQLVQKGELVGLSGETGYTEGPHLHLTIRLNGQSVDPMTFYALFGVK